MFADPIKNLNYLALGPGMAVADFGIGSGFYALGAARQVGPTGVVYAIDIQKDLLDRLSTQATAEHLNNIETFWGNLEERGGAKIADDRVDVVIISNLLFQVDSKYGLALEAKRVVRPGGKVLVVDWQDSYGGLGPQADQVVTADEAIKVFMEAGFTKETDIPAGAHHYGIIFKLAKK